MFERWRLRVRGDSERGREQRKHYPSNPFHETNPSPHFLTLFSMMDCEWSTTQSPGAIYSPKTSASGVFLLFLLKKIDDVI